MARYVGFKMGKVHENHTVSDYYCGRCGYPVTDHDSYCPECGGAFRESDADCLEDETRDLKAKNAKLRELIFDMLVDEERGHNDDGTYYEHVSLAKELGIEVDNERSEVSRVDGK